MKICLYGMPTAGKTYIMDKIDFMETLAGSEQLREICPQFDHEDDAHKNMVRQVLAAKLLSKDSFIMDGHYAFGDKVVFTENDGRLYDVFLYLYISPEVLMKRMMASEKNKKYLFYDIEQWQLNEIDGLRTYCHKNDKDFYVIDNPPCNVFDDIRQVISFIRAVNNGYSCRRFAADCVEQILKLTGSDTVTLMDGDKTITREDSSSAVFGYKTHLYDGNFYTGYQSWKQMMEFESYELESPTQMPVSLNERVCGAISEDTFILTSGHEKVWRFIANYLGVSFYYGKEMSAETKYFITKMLQNNGKKVVAYGDGMNDYYMLRQADKGYLVAKTDGSVSRSLKGRDLGGVEVVRA